MYAHLCCCQSLSHVTINCTYFNHALHSPFHCQLLDDYALVRPTVVASTPRFWNMLYNKYLQALQSAYRQYLSLSPEEREKEFEEKVEGVKEKKMQEVVRGEKEVVSGEEEVVRSEEEVVRGEEGKVKSKEEGRKRGMSSEREEVEKVEEAEEKGEPKEEDKELEDKVKEEGGQSAEEIEAVDRRHKESSLERGSGDKEGRQQFEIASDEAQTISSGDESAVHMRPQGGHQTHVRPQLSHLSSFDGEMEDTLEEGLVPLHLDTGSDTAEQPAVDTEGGVIPAVVASDGGVSEAAFDPSAVPYRVRERVMRQFKSILGGREYFVVTGGAPTSESVKRFISDCFGGLPSEGYGATEVNVHRKQSRCCLLIIPFSL